MNKTDRMNMLGFAAEMMTNRDSEDFTDQGEMIVNQLMTCLITDDWSQLNSQSCAYVNALREGAQ